MAKTDFTVLTTTDSYPAWFSETRAALLAARVWRHVNTQVPTPTYANVDAPTEIEKREMRIFLENEEQALGIILERIDAANARLVGTNEAHDAWTVLEAAHVVQTANRQYQLYQAMANTRQKPDEALPTYMQRVEQAADR
ncbi:hypothetical protein M407DRAFT_86719, partial [Tulasnella calospora MUT 4182]